MIASDSMPTSREYLRTPVTLPVEVRITHAWEGGAQASLQGVLRDVSRGGAGLSMPWVVPPRTRLAVDVPTGGSGIRLVAEVVWTSLAPGRESSLPAYGVRWVEFLSRQRLDMMLPLEQA